LNRFDFSAADSRLDGVNLHGAFAGKVSPHPACAFALFQPNDRSHASVSCAIEMQNQVLARAFGVSEMFEVYDPSVRQAQQVHVIAD
jgi:hypothetical protein